MNVSRTAIPPSSTSALFPNSYSESATVPILSRSRTLFPLLTFIAFSLVHLVAAPALVVGQTEQLRDEALRAREELIATAHFMYPSEFGIKLPDGEPERYPFKNVLTIDERGRGCVGRVHAKVGENFLVMLPSGRIAPRLKKDVTEEFGT